MKQGKRQGRKGKIYPNECIVTEINKANKKAFLNEQCKKTEENKRMENTRDLFKKNGYIKGTVHARMAQSRTKNCK